MNHKPPHSDAIMNAAIRLRAIQHNREVNATVQQQREWDDRVSLAETHLESALLESGEMVPEDAIEEISIEGHEVTIVFEGRECIILHLPSCK